MHQSIAARGRTPWSRDLSIMLSAMLLAVCSLAPAHAAGTTALTGTLYGPDGSAAGGIEISAMLLRDDGAVTTDAITVTDDDGAFVLSDLTARRTYVLWVRDRRDEVVYPWGFVTDDPDDAVHQDVARARTFVPDESGILDLHLTVETAPTISGALLNADGTPVVGIEVQAVTVESGRRLEPRGVARTGLDGGFVLRGAEPGTYRLWLEGEPFFGNGFAGAHGAEPARIEEARVIDTRGGPVADVNVSIPDVRLPADRFVLSEPLTYRNPTTGIVEVGDGALSWFSLGFGDRLNGGMPLRTGFDGQTVYAPGDFFQEQHAVFNDIITVDRQGKMFLHPGGGGSFGPPRQIGHGWASLRVVPGGDVNQDGYGDILAIDVSGRLLLYRGDGSGGFLGPARMVGNGWVGFELHAAGDLDRDGRADILAVDSAGKLWTYAGKGDGTFATRKQVGKGWGTYTLAAGADLDGDGWADIVGRDDATGGLHLYKGQSNGTFATKRLLATGW